MLPLILACAAGLPASAQKATSWRAGNLQAVEAWTQAQHAQAAGNTNVWIARGVVANRATRQVQAIAEATGLDKDAILSLIHI